ncbi:MAG: Transrane exosortase (Exosortase EpsH) [Dehalococcoidales bacterium]|nr:Transrane exosortase (Exosortase EpsH) [Dehalococcoidales bacterium]
MNTVTVKGVQSWRKSWAARKLALWLLLSIMLSLIFFRKSLTGLPAMLSPDWVLGQYHASGWGVLAVCLVVLWLKRKEMWQGMSREGSLIVIPIGLALIAGALLMPSSQDYLVFQLLLASLGVFVTLFGYAAKIPSVLLVTYGFVISFPLAMQSFAENAYTQTAMVPLMGLMNVLDYPVAQAGQRLHFISTSGEAISVSVTIGCAGTTTMGVFMALFTLMMLDKPLPLKKAGWLFLFGVVGTWFQNLVRLVLLILAGYYLGKNALWTAHLWIVYTLFPLWYLFFAYMYFRQGGQSPKVRRMQELKYITETGR